MTWMMILGIIVKAHEHLTGSNLDNTVKFLCPAFLIRLDCLFMTFGLAKQVYDRPYNQSAILIVDYSFVSLALASTMLYVISSYISGCCPRRKSGKCTKENKLQSNQ